MINFFLTKKKNLSLRHPQNGRFSDFETKPETPFGNRKFFFHQIKLIPTLFWGKIYRELRWRWNHSIIISGLQSKVEKTMKNFVFSTFDCDPEIIMKWL